MIAEAKRIYDPKAADKIIPVLLKARPLVAKIDARSSALWVKKWLPSLLPSPTQS